MSRAKIAAAWVAPVLAMIVSAGQARADEHMVLVDTIDVGGNGLGELLMLGHGVQLPKDAVSYGYG